MALLILKVFEVLETHTFGYSLQLKSLDELFVGQHIPLSVEMPTQYLTIVLLRYSVVQCELIELLMVEHAVPVGVEQIQQLVGVTSLDAILDLLEQQDRLFLVTDLPTYPTLLNDPGALQVQLVIKRIIRLGDEL